MYLAFHFIMIPNEKLVKSGIDAYNKHDDTICITLFDMLEKMSSMKMVQNLKVIILAQFNLIITSKIMNINRKILYPLLYN
jgi:hypothetical protein